MKYLRPLAALAFCAASITGCLKNKDYSAIDHTDGVIRMRKWSGKAYGNCRLDSSYKNPVTNVVEHKILLRRYSRIINDSMFSLVRLDDFTIKVFGYWMGYRYTNEKAQLVVFDSVYNYGTDTSFVKFNKLADTLGMQLHILSDQDPYTKEYYQDHWVLHTVD